MGTSVLECAWLGLAVLGWDCAGEGVYGAQLPGQLDPGDVGVLSLLLILSGVAATVLPNLWHAFGRHCGLTQTTVQPQTV